MAHGRGLKTFFAMIMMSRAILALQLRPSSSLISRRVIVATRASSIDTSPTHPNIKAKVANAASQDFVPASLLDRAAAAAGMGVVSAAVGATDVIPVEVRLVLASLLVFSVFEYCFHRWVMHARNDAIEKGAFKKFQALHLNHHCETLSDMQLKEGGDSDPRHIYFSTTTSVASVLISTAVLTALDSVFHLGFLSTAIAGGDSSSLLQSSSGFVVGSSLLPCFGASCAVALLHTSLWQTLHGDIHEYYTEYGQGLSRTDALSQDTLYTRWMVSNHVGHHVVKGQGNYNIVFPGPDYLWGTCFVPAPEAAK